MDPISVENPPPATTGTVSVVIHAGIAYVSGQLPRIDGKLHAHGKVGDAVDLATARQAARICAEACLDRLDKAVGRENILRTLKMTGYVASAPGFNQQGAVLDAASELLIEHLGAPAGTHARTSIGVAELPQNAPVEVDLVAAVRSPNAGPD